MHRCYVDSTFWNDSEMILPPASEHHLINVLRVSAGEMVELFDGKGRDAVARVAIEKGRRAVLKVEESSFVKPPLFSVSLIQALPKGTKMDLIVEKATELGVTKIYPMITERVVVRMNDSARKEERRERWQRITISAAEQSGVKWIPEVKPVMTIEEAVSAGRDSDVFIVGALASNARLLHGVLSEMRKKKSVTASLLIGPEGDLTPLELKMAIDAGAIPVSFGPNVFRVETAALFGLSVLIYELSNSTVFSG
ncbi:MAG: RsmE family RNA methyltransferase [Kiritimatiellae bacterium]|nr:RsmE family RNA methyltransferase [Kiritimatiellia bacterium]MDD5520758.1 RsmE family RNA methyltransferase [Kiritimatiellia bacterium]